MVNVTNRPYVAVRLIPIKFFFRHFLFLCSAGVPPAVARASRPRNLGFIKISPGSTAIPNHFHLPAGSARHRAGESPALPISPSLAPWQ
jgi:hypothetical protein